MENEATRVVEDNAASDKYGSNLGLVGVGSKERRAKILSREEREEIERGREREKKRRVEKAKIQMRGKRESVSE